MTYLDGDTAKNIIKRAEEKALSMNLAVCICLVDEGAHLLAFQRMDKAALGPVDISQRKARTAALFRRDSGKLGEVIREKDLTGFEQSNGGLAAFPGGLPIWADGKLIGAIGISGACAAEDLEIAEYAIESLT